MHVGYNSNRFEMHGGNVMSRAYVIAAASICFGWFVIGGAVPNSIQAEELAVIPIQTSDFPLAPLPPIIPGNPPLPVVFWEL